MDDVKSQLEIAKLRRMETNKDPRICKCGHAARCHTSESDRETHRTLRAVGRFACFVGRQTCPCQKFEPVMTTSDIRKFIFKTEGPAESHALARGAMKAWELGVTVEWIPGTSCDMCQGQGLALFPLALGPGGTEAHEPTATNVLLCTTCRGKLTRPDA
jgi:hypothetical protein